MVCLVVVTQLRTFLIVMMILPLIQTRYVKKVNHIPGFVFHPDKHTGRILQVEGTFDLSTPIPVQYEVEEVESQFRTTAEDGDVMGFYVDPKIGGPADKKTNVVAMNPSVAEFWKSNVSEFIYQELKQDARGWSLTVYPEYGNMSSTRPQGFVFLVLRDVNFPEKQGLKGYIPNPPKAMMSRTQKPILYRTFQWKSRLWRKEPYIVANVKGNQSETLERVEITLFNIVMNKNGLIVNDCGAEETQQTQFKKSAQREDDVPGLLLSERLGGCLNNPYIVVPMSPRAVNQYKAKVEDPIIAYLNASTYNPFEDSSISPPWSSKVLTTVFVMYPDEVSIRPAGFFFHSTIRGLVTVTSIYIPN